MCCDHRDQSKPETFKVAGETHGLVLVGRHKPDLFDLPPIANTAHPAARSRGKLEVARDQLNKTYGKSTLYFAASHTAKDTEMEV